MDVDGGHPPVARAFLRVGVANGGGGAARRPRDTDRAERGGVSGCGPSRRPLWARSDVGVMSAGVGDVAVDGPAAGALARRARRGVEDASPAFARERQGRRAAAAAATAADGTPRWAGAAALAVGASTQTTADVGGTGSATRVDAGGGGVAAAAVAV